MLVAMIFRLLILYGFICSCLSIPPLSEDESNIKGRRCQFGYMTEKQSWVNEVGALLTIPFEETKSLDMSMTVNPVPTLRQNISSPARSKQYIKYLSLARCELSKVPPIFTFRYNNGPCLYETVEYVSFFGNSFVGPSSAGDLYSSSLNATRPREVNMEDQLKSQVANVWSAGFASITFTKLKELDLRACSIQILGENLFRGMPNLQALYLGENEISYIDSTAFVGLGNLLHLDMSRNRALDENANPRTLNSNTYLVFQDLKNLTYLDLSHTKLTKQNLGMILSLGPSLKSLSLCDTGLSGLQPGVFNSTSIQLLDISSNAGILSFDNTLQGLQDHLMFLYANEISLPTMDIFFGFTKLELLQLSHNEIFDVSDELLETLKSLFVLDLDKNRLTTWFKPTFSRLPKLRYLSLEANNINLITEAMMEDLANIDYLALSDNFMVCNCIAKDFYKKAYRNEKIHNETLLKTSRSSIAKDAYSYYNTLISRRHPIQLDCDETCLGGIKESGRFRLIDYYPESYVCLLVPESRAIHFGELTGCDGKSRYIGASLNDGKRKLIILVTIPCFFLPLAVMFVFRRHIRYFIITMRNSAMLSLINRKDVVVSDTILTYDVFVSYCNEDRGWVLEHLLPHMEAECSVSACLHERDFQVGLSILENIVSCMDRSKSIMLIISQRFLLSQWCQFEMHLAQHRLLETRREDLILILLEDIPRRLRPNTLHYLMLTKTYIVWPKEESERHLFWKRLKKTLMSQKSKYNTENATLA